MHTIAFIPARMASTRFPGKPLASIAGRPMLEHCHRGAAGAALVSDVVVATCDPEIEAWAEGAGVASAMTSDRHERATDRVAEAAARTDAEAIALIQGDEPMVTPEMVDAALGPIVAGEARCTNLVKRIESREDLENPNTIKIVSDPAGRALYFSRSPIPASAKDRFEDVTAFKQVCVFGFTREALLEFSELEPTRLEVLESIDMLRYLEHGRPVHLVETDVPTHAVDVPADIPIVERALSREPGEVAR
jgi:3-deoxy-manno-octulosonate cytidylyltransferase (CMP-KDO synthetase)